MYTPLSNDVMQEQIFKLLTNIQETQTSDGKVIARLEANQDHMKEAVTKIEEKITSIEKIDHEQTNSLKEHMRRTKQNEEAIGVLHDTVENTIGNYHDLVLTVNENIKPKERKPIGRLIKENIKFIVGIIVALAGASAGIMALVNLFK